ncbi:MAG TPA: hypothetical protein VKB76_00720 [Ktedonobacterales bacterium]|nr:hypothetical protein [Ktedonobacterales bacterium]
MQELPRDVAASDGRSSASRFGRIGRGRWIGSAVAAISVILLVAAFLHVLTLPRTSPVIIISGIGGACPTATHFSQSITLSDLSMVSPDEGWAVGGVASLDQSSADGVILHYINDQWLRISGDFAGIEFTSISMISPTNGWLTGILSNKSPNENTVYIDDHLLYHYDGHTWQPVPFDQSAFDNNYGGSPGDLVVRMHSATDGWLMVRETTLLGNYSLLHYDGNVWRKVQSPFVSTQSTSYLFSDIRVGGPDEVWLAGEHVPGPNAVTAHYQAGKWSTITNATGIIDSLALTSARDGYAVDSYYNHILHFDEQHTSLVSLPDGLLHANEHLTAIFAAPDGTIWVVGDIDSLTTPASFLLHRLADGTWKRTAIPYHNERVGELIFTSSGDIWAVGAISYQQGCAPALVRELDQGTILHWNNGQWSQIVEPAS